MQWRRADEAVDEAPDPARHGNADWSDESQKLLALKSSLFCIQTSGFISRVAELSARLRLMKSKPSVLGLTEAWADKGLPTMRIEGNKLISGHDRADGRQGGGVAVFALENVAHKVTHLEDSTVAERSWVIVHSDHGLT